VVPIIHPHRQFIWPASSGVLPNGVGFSSTCYGCYGRRKRSAPVFPSIDGVFGIPHNSAVATTTWGFPRAKRSAEAPVFPSIDGVFGIPHNSAVATTTWGFPRVKRSPEAEPEAKPGLLYNPYPYGLPFYHVPVVPVVPVIKGDGIAAHPNGATAFRGATTYGYQ